MQPCWLTSFNGPAADMKSEVVSAFHSIAWLSASMAAHGEGRIESRAFQCSLGCSLLSSIGKRHARCSGGMGCKISIMQKLVNGQGHHMCLMAII